MEIQQKIIFGCYLRSFGAQFGWNQNPTTYNMSVVEDESHHFTLAGLPRQGMRHIEHIQIGSLDFYGLIQMWDNQIINVAGSGVYSVRMTDMRPAMDCVQVVVQSPTGVNLGENVVLVQPETNEDLVGGVKYSTIKNRIESVIYKYGEISFRVNLSDITTTSRTIQSTTGLNERIPYRVRGSAMSLIEFINQVADDHGFEWYVDTVKNGSVYDVYVRTLQRKVVSLDMDGLASQYPNSVIRLVTGVENRDEVTRTIVLGANKQTLTKYNGSLLKPFWGFDDEGGVLTSPRFKIVSREGIIRTRFTSIDEMKDALNGRITNLPEEELKALTSYAENHWGRTFYIDIPASLIDSDNVPWIDTVNEGWWEDNTSPESLPTDGQLKFGVSDGRWVAFAVLNNPSTVGGEWADQVVDSSDLLGTGQNRYYMKISVDRVDLYKVPGAPSNKRGSILLITFPVPLEVLIGTRTSYGALETNGEVSRMTQVGSVYIPIIDRRDSYGPWTSDTLIPPQLRLPGKTRVVFDSSLTPWAYSYRGMSMDDAIDIMNKIAYARIRTYTHRITEFDTGELEVPGLPTVNLGTAIGRGTNITNISVSYDIRGVTTVYKCNLYTNELGRYQRYYQELIDKLKRDQARQQYPEYPEDIFKDPPEHRVNRGAGGDGSIVAKIISRDSDHPWYMCQIHKQTLVNGYVQLVPAAIFNVAVTNLSEYPDAPAHLPIGMFLRIKPAKWGLYPDRYTSNNIVAVTAWVVEEALPSPPELKCTIARSLNPPSSKVGPPNYEVTVVEGDTSMFTDSELNLLDTVLNLGEPYSGPGYIPVGTAVSVRWVEQENHTFKPYIDQAMNVFMYPSEIS